MLQGWFGEKMWRQLDRFGVQPGSSVYDFKALSNAARRSAECAGS